MHTPTAEYAQQVAERITREFNESLAAFMGRAVRRRQADEFQRRYEQIRRLTPSAA